MNVPQSQISNLKPSNYAIIVAGGSGTRMKSPVPKQFLLLNGVPVLMHTIAAFGQCATKPNIMLVLPINYHGYWEQLCREHSFNIDHQVVAGGETRFHSVQNALAKIDNGPGTLIAVHDAVRPLVTGQLIDKSYAEAAEFGNAVAAVKSRDSVRMIQGDTSINLPRENVYLVQTPQTFKADQLKKAYERTHHIKFTDDAGVTEESGVEIHLMEGSYLNIKITHPEDIGIAEVILQNFNNGS